MVDSDGVVKAAGNNHTTYLVICSEQIMLSSVPLQLHTSLVVTNGQLHVWNCIFNKHNTKEVICGC